ncbi:PP2C family serine/threonine-protein phosphatase [Glaciihabitans sp. dw_435]|uniref:PP2C family protein-serine/threonine phosphatase n=1 Tax=Glaciihabitans sp. dw_435 TaxID=2720081 RepID=UPI001BD1DAE1|nr:protein phosphatase 2C domain-containing protein [Glaciihabitans sp. dw_435]
MTEIGTSTAEFTVALPGHPESVVRLSWAAATDVGKRRRANEDSYVARSPMFAVADGMGGHAAGDLASAAVVTRLAEMTTTDFLSAAAVDTALVRATEDIDVVSVGNDMGVGTTATGAILAVEGGKPYFGVFNVGDSRVYSYTPHELVQVTTDHSVVQEMVDSGLISRAQAEIHPDSNIITRAVGFGEAPEVDYWLVPMRAGLRLLICSDGLTKEVDDHGLLAELAAGHSALDTAAALVQAALDAGGRDNVTTIIVDVLSVPAEN